MGTDAERALIEVLRLSKAGREVCPAVLADAARWALARYPEKHAEKAAKARLHQLYGSWVADGWAKCAGSALLELERGNIGAREAALRLASLHSSTRERAAHLEACYAKVLDVCGPVASVLDVACGMNPVSFYLLGRKDIALLALDAGAAVADALNRFFALAGMRNARALAADALAGLPPGRHDLALVMKFLPLAERIRAGRSGCFAASTPPISPSASPRARFRAGTWGWRRTTRHGSRGWDSKGRPWRASPAVTSCFIS